MDRLFSLSNLLVMPFWALMIALPRWRAHAAVPSTALLYQVRRWLVPARAASARGLRPRPVCGCARLACGNTGADASLPC